AMPEAAMAEHLEILRRGLRRRRCVGDRGGEALAFERYLRRAGDRARRLDTDHFKQGRHEIAGMHELMPQLALRLDPVRPRDHEGIADSAAMGVLLVAAQRRVRRHRPAVREIAVRVGPADVVDAADFFRDRLGAEIEWAHRVDEAERTALLARAI